LPQTSSYDYDAPIDEAGNATEKFYAIRKLFANYLQAGEVLPAVPVANKIQKLQPVAFSSVALLTKNLPKPVLADTAMLMEDLDQDFGCILYETALAAGQKASLVFKDIHDYALVYIDGKKIGELDRRKNKFSIEIEARAAKSTLRILVEATGRVNYGYQMHDRKGIHGAVYLSENGKQTELKNWKNYPIRLGEVNIPLRYEILGKQTAAAAFYKGSFNANKLEDTYLDMGKWNKGLVWLNGMCLGRYWNIGPTQTMLVPGSWLKKGKNEVVVFDLFGMDKPALSFLDKPILDVVNEKQPELHRKANQKWDNTQKAYAEGSFANDNKWQQVDFKPVTARYFCLEALSEQKGQPYSSVAEIILLDDKGNEVPRTDWKVVYADSEELGGNDGNAANVFDLQFTSYWHTQWEDKSPKPPHQLVIDMGKNYTIKGLKLLPRQDNANGRIKDYRLYFNQTPFKGL